MTFIMTQINQWRLYHKTWNSPLLATNALAHCCQGNQTILETKQFTVVHRWGSKQTVHFLPLTLSFGLRIFFQNKTKYIYKPINWTVNNILNATFDASRTFFPPFAWRHYFWREIWTVFIQHNSVDFPAAIRLIIVIIYIPNLFTLSSNLNQQNVRLNTWFFQHLLRNKTISLSGSITSHVTLFSRCLRPHPDIT